MREKKVSHVRENISHVRENAEHDEWVHGEKGPAQETLFYYIYKSG